METLLKKAVKFKEQNLKNGFTPHRFFNDRELLELAIEYFNGNVRPKDCIEAMWYKKVNNKSNSYASVANRLGLRLKRAIVAGEIKKLELS